MFLILISFSQNIIVVLPVCSSVVRQMFAKVLKYWIFIHSLQGKNLISLFDLKIVFLKSMLFTYKS